MIVGSTYNGSWDHWYGPTGREGCYSTDLVLESITARALESIGYGLNPQIIQTLRTESEVICFPSSTFVQPEKCEAFKAPCLFNIETDPCELRNLAAE